MLSVLRAPATLRHDTDLHRGVELAVVVLRAGGSLRIKTRGGSMLPFLRDGDVAVVAPTPTERVARGDVICYESAPGRLFLHRVIRRDAARFVVKGDALRIAETVDAAAVLGTVVAVERGGRTRRWDNDAAQRWNSTIALVSHLLPIIVAVALPVRRALRAACRG
jgi:hypothetical protein